MIRALTYMAACAAVAFALAMVAMLPGARAQEQQDRSAKRGLWAQPSPQAPWDWRAERRSGAG